MFKIKRKTTVKNVEEKKTNRSTYIEQKEANKRLSLKVMTLFALALIVVIPTACGVILYFGEYPNVKDINVYFGLPLSVLGASVITAVGMNYLTLDANGVQRANPKKYMFLFIFLILFTSISVLFVAEVLLVENGLNRLFDVDDPLADVILARIFISVIGSLLIVAIDGLYKRYFKDHFLAGVVPVGKRRRLIIHLSRSNVYFKTEKEGRLFELGKSEGAQFSEDVNQYVNDILKEYEALSEIKLLRKQPELTVFCEKQCKKWTALRKTIKVTKNKNEVLGLIGSEQYKDIEELNKLMSDLIEKRIVIM